MTRATKNVSLTQPHHELIARVAHEKQMKFSEALRHLIDFAIDADPELNLPFLVDREKLLRAELSTVQEAIKALERKVSDRAEQLPNLKTDEQPLLLSKSKKATHGQPIQREVGLEQVRAGDTRLAECFFRGDRLSPKVIDRLQHRAFEDQVWLGELEKRDPELAATMRSIVPEVLKDPRLRAAMESNPLARISEEESRKGMERLDARIANMRFKPDKQGVEA